MAAELISLSVWLDHILSMSSQAVGGVLWWGSLGDGEGWGEREGRERGRGRNGSGVDGWRGLRDGQCRQFSLKRTPALHP